MAEIREDLKYSKEHEWAQLLENGNVRIGITDYAQNSLGDIVYIDIPEAGTDVEQHDTFGTIESVKAVSDLYSPMDGEIISVNEKVVDEPALVNSDPYGDGWLIEITPTSVSQYEEMLDEKEYAQLIENL